MLKSNEFDHTKLTATNTEDRKISLRVLLNELADIGWRQREGMTRIAKYRKTDSSLIAAMKHNMNSLYSLPITYKR